MSRRAGHSWRWNRRTTGLYDSADAQLDRAELWEYAEALAAVVDDLEPERAAWYARDLVLNAGEQGGAEPHLPCSAPFGRWRADRHGTGTLEPSRRSGRPPCTGAARSLWRRPGRPQRASQ